MMEKRKKKHASAQAQRISKVKHDRKHILSRRSGFYLQEAYRALRTNVNFALADTEGCKVVMVPDQTQPDEELREKLFACVETLTEIKNLIFL